MSNVVHIPLAQGTRVRVITTHRPPPPHDRGIIWKHEPESGGYLVQHDSSPWPAADGLPGETARLFGWAYAEIEVEEPAVAADPHPAGPPAGRLPRTPAEQHRFHREALHLSLCAAEDGISEQKEEDLLMQLDTLWTQLTEVERDAGRTCAPDLRVDGTGPQACAYLIRAPVPRTPAEQHRSLMETLLALRAAEGGIAETQEEEILVRLDELWGQLTEAERDVEWGSVWPTKPEDK